MRSEARRTSSLRSVRSSCGRRRRHVHLGLVRLHLSVIPKPKSKEGDQPDHRKRNAAVPLEAALITGLAFRDGLDVGAKGVDQVVGLDDQTSAFDDLLLDLAHFVFDVSHGKRPNAEAETRQGPALDGPREAAYKPTQGVSRGVAIHLSMRGFGGREL